jgi:hypothetical protein
VVSGENSCKWKPSAVGSKASFSKFLLCFYGGFLITPVRCLIKYL